jgi:TolB-like protein/Tfp pilus assembly protein PilF
MTSIVAGYEYDIFISYRQKDNEYDGWVTEFVNNLKRELHATFKEDISIYFDVNPQDGLLETHIVNESLSKKLKCLIFIPIVSQTYCDSKSFAWQHEFCAFNKLAKENQFGRDIRLAGGNVASRVLPVKIHDLDPEDKTLLENELGGVIRCIEFIYKSAGVNRPLRAYEDHPHDNLNKTYYRDQINKVANAVKEIITSIKKHELQDGEVPKEVVKDKPEHPKNLKLRIIVSSIIVLALMAIGYFFIPKLFKSSEPIEKSIAVLPFNNLSSDKDQVWFSDGITDVIITQLSKISDLRVLGRTSTLKYREEQKSISEIGAELGVNYVIEGSVQREGNKMRITVQLIRVINEGHIWSDIYDRNWKDIFEVQSDIAQKIAERLKTVLTPEEKVHIEKNETENPEAYNLYLKGRYFWDFRTEATLLKAIGFFNQAVKLDSNYVLAYTGLADSYIMLAWYSTPSSEVYLKAEQAALKALEIDNSLAEAHATMGFIKFSKWEVASAEKEYLKAIELDPDYATTHHWYAMLLAATGRFNQAINEILEARNHDPLSLVINRNTGVIFNSARQYDKGIEALNRVIELDSDFTEAHRDLAEAYLNKGMYENALSEIQKSNDKIWTGIIYARSGQLDKAKQILDELILSSKSKYISPFELAILYFSLGSENQGFSSLEKAYEIHDLQLAEIRMYPELDKYTSNPRYIDLIRKIGLQK